MTPVKNDKTKTLSTSGFKPAITIISEDNKIGIGIKKAGGCVIQGHYSYIPARAAMLA